MLVYKVGEGWDRLCEFLGHEVPDEQFPHENKAGTDDTVVNKLSSSMYLDIKSRRQRSKNISAENLCCRLSIFRLIPFQEMYLIQTPILHLHLFLEAEKYAIGKDGG